MLDYIIQTHVTSAITKQSLSNDKEKHLKSTSLFFFFCFLNLDRIKREYLGNKFQQRGGRYISDIFDRPPCSPKASSKVRQQI